MLSQQDSSCSLLYSARLYMLEETEGEEIVFPDDVGDAPVASYFDGSNESEVSIIKLFAWGQTWRQDDSLRKLGMEKSLQTICRVHYWKPRRRGNLQYFKGGIYQLHRKVTQISELWTAGYLDEGAL